MKLIFLGTRGNIEARSRLHHRHASLLVTSRRGKVMIDCGADWLDRVSPMHPDAIVVTHAHPDHIGGLKRGAPAPVHASGESWQLLDSCGIRHRYVLRPRTAVEICGTTFEAFPVEHSLRAPAVGYRIRAGGACVFYVPDLVSIPDRAAALSGVELYVGDGATLTRPLVRRRGRAFIGHAPVAAQLGWCQEEGVPWAIFTHCGSQVVCGDGRRLAARVRALGKERGVKAQLAHDGMEIVLRRGGARCGSQNKDGNKGDGDSPHQTSQITRESRP
jgi:phosphoribosyl 1,2-cyclic phosphodiesterase